MYKAYKNCKYVISLIPIENDYLFKIWGINSILMDNPLTFEYDSIIPSNLSDKNIIMIGRGSDRLKRFELGIESMKYIIKEIPECIMNIISESVEEQEKLIKTLNLEKNVKFTGFQSNIDVYLKNTSLHIFPSIAEGYPMVLGETKMYGIPTILCGLDYLALAKGGTVMVYDDNPETIAKEAIKILKNETYRKILGDEARKSMEKRKNEFIEQRWAKLLSLVHKGDDESILKLNENKMTDKEAEEILINQLKMIHLRRPNLKDVTLDQLKSYELV
jgi:glycosyltransferase involved in cell wall biosynthesis